MHLFFSKPTRALAALAEESLDRLAGAPLRVGVQMRLGGGEWNDPERYSSMLPPQRCKGCNTQIVMFISGPSKRRQAHGAIPTDFRGMLQPMVH